ncbi:MAG: phosphatidate cytidylyltransferase [Hydrocarboniphaga effusa]|nr:phosphatidate cytidylyltransferase [Hydrocarboniphaga effusa]
MLIQRVVTALLLLPPLLALIWFGSTAVFYAVLSVIALGIAWEWAALMGLASRAGRAAYATATALLLTAAWFLREHWLWFAVVSALWWLAALYVLSGFPENFKRQPPVRWQMALLGQILLLPAMLCLAQLHAMPKPDGALRVRYVLFLVFAADVGAYLAGRNLGRRKLAPEISPGKTVEGALGGFALCALWALTAGSYVFAVDTGAQLAKVLALSLAVAAFSIVGDLTESMFKRLAGVKDSGALLPGHGGLLDRVDSILAAVPIMALGAYLLAL